MEALLRKTGDVSTFEQDTNAQASTVRLAHRYHQIDADIEGFIEAIKSHKNEHTILSKFEALSQWHNQHYKTAIERIITPSIQAKDKQALVSKWVELRKTRAQIHQDLWAESSDLTQAVTDALMQKANRNLIIDTGLVLLCVIMGMFIGMKVKRIKYRAEHDELTKLLTQSRFSYLLRNELDSLDTSSSLLALMVIDLPKYDEISDTLGREHGEALLQETADRLRLISKDHVLTARYREAQFTVLYGCKDVDDALVAGKRLYDEINEPVNVNERLLDAGIKVGIAVYPDHGENSKELENAADFALLQPQTDNQNKVSLYDLDMAEKLRYRIEIESELPNAVDQNELQLHYQPQICTNENRSNRLEALIRWQHPTRGFMPPGEFLSIAEQGGYMPLIGNWVMREAIRQCAEWNSTSGADPVMVAVNVAADQFIQKDFVETVLTYLYAHKLDAKFLEVEITESLVIQDIDQVTQALKALRDNGIKISLDDFGTGYSSLSQLHTLPIDILKIDRAFVSRLDCSSNPSTTVTSTIIRMAKDYGLEVVAEGAETDAQVNALRRLGADLIQGYYYSKPVPAADVISVLESINHSLNYTKSA